MTHTLVPEAAEARAEARGRVPFAFGARFFVALLLGLMWLIPAWWWPGFLAAMFLWDGLVFLAWIADLARLPRPETLAVRRTWDGPLSLAREASVGVEVSNTSGRALYATLIDETPHALRNEPPSLELTLPGAGEYAVLPRQRGDVALGRMYLRYRSAWGLAERWAVASARQTVRILPDLEQARQHALYLVRSHQVEMEKRRRRQRGFGREFESLRDYREGDDLRDVYWQATARRHQLTTRVYQVERSQPVWIVIDAGRLLRAQVHDKARAVPSTKLDYAVDGALSLAQVASQTGDRVGLLAYGRSVQQSVALGRGPLHLRAMVDALALVRGEPAEANHALAVRAVLRAQTRRSLIVWITDFAETPMTPEVIEYASQIAHRHLVVFAAISQRDLAALAAAIPQNEDEMFRHTAALEIVQRREVLLRGLRQRGVLAADLQPGVLASSLVNQYLEIKDRALI